MPSRRHLLNGSIFIALGLAACGTLQADLEPTPLPEAAMTENAGATGAAYVRGLAAATATALRLTASANETLGTPGPTLVATDMIGTEVSPPPQGASPIPPRPTTAATQVPPTQAPPLEVTPEPVVIQSFTVDRTSIQPGEAVNLSWVSSGGAIARLYQTGRSTDTGREWDDLPPNGSLTVQVGGSPRDAYQFSLFVFSTIDTYQGTVDMKSLLVRLPCPDAYFFPAPANWQPSQAYFPIDDETCPASPAISASMAEQVFERGRMIWIQSLDVICVLYDDSSRLSEIYPDTWTTGEPDSDPNLVPPSGLLQPMRGFGKVWRENSPVRERLGWASATERPFSSLYQQSWSTYYQRPGDTIFLRDAQGRVLRLYRAYYGRFSMRAWEVVAP